MGESRRISSKSISQVVTVDEAGRATGVAGLDEAHRPPGRLHLAVSVQLVDEHNRWIVQRRSSSKLMFASRWANSCCTHPTPDESLAAAAARRVSEELGVGVMRLEHRGTFIYKAYDAASGMVEHELDHVYLGRATAAPAPSRAEIDEIAHLSLGDVTALFGDAAAAPWAQEVLALARPSDYAVP